MLFGKDTSILATQESSKTHADYSEHSGPFLHMHCASPADPPIFEDWLIKRCSTWAADVCKKLPAMPFSSAAIAFVMASTSVAGDTMESTQKATDIRTALLHLVAHDCGYPLSRYTCRATRVAADFLDFIAFCRCSTGVALHPLKILVSHLPPPVPGGVAPKFGSEKVSRYTGVSQLQLRVSRYTVQLSFCRAFVVVMNFHSQSVDLVMDFVQIFSVDFLGP